MWLFRCHLIVIHDFRPLSHTDFYHIVHLDTKCLSLEPHRRMYLKRQALCYAGRWTPRILNTPPGRGEECIVRKSSVFSMWTAWWIPFISARQNEHIGFLRKWKTLENVVFSRVCGGAYWTRTSDPIDVNDVLYQLSQSTGNKMYYSTEEVDCQYWISDFLFSSYTGIGLTLAR